MTLDQIKTFLWVARLGGFRRAAEQLNLTQPAVSTRVSTLEDELQVKLIERGSKGLTLTRNGALLVSYAQQMLFVQEEIRRSVADVTEMDGLFRIGASETVAQSWLPAFMKQFADAYPRVNLELTVDISLNLREALLGRQLDLAFLMGPVSEFTVENVVLPDFPLKWFKPAGMGEVDLRETPIISFSSQTRPHRELSTALSRKIGPSARIFASASLSASLQMIAQGVAVGPFPYALSAKLIERGMIEEFDPGIEVSPLVFTASYIAEPYSFLAESSAKQALTIAQAWKATSVV